MGKQQCDPRDVGRALHSRQPGGKPERGEAEVLGAGSCRQRAVQAYTTHKVVARRLDRGNGADRDLNALFDVQVVRWLGGDGLLVPRCEPCEDVGAGLRQPAEINLAIRVSGCRDLYTGAKVGERGGVDHGAFHVGRVEAADVEVDVAVGRGRSGDCDVERVDRDVGDIERAIDRRTGGVVQRDGRAICQSVAVERDRDGRGAGLIVGSRAEREARDSDAVARAQAVRCAGDDGGGIACVSRKAGGGLGCERRSDRGQHLRSERYGQTEIVVPDRIRGSARCRQIVVADLGRAVAGIVKPLLVLQVGRGHRDADLSVPREPLQIVRVGRVAQRVQRLDHASALSVVNHNRLWVGNQIT